MHFVMLAQGILYCGAGFDIVWPQFLALAAIGGTSSGSRMPASGAPSAQWREQDGYGRGCLLALAPSRRVYLVREWVARGEI